MADSENYRKGLEVRRRLLGDAQAARMTSSTDADPVMKQFAEFAIEHVFGAVWTRPGLDFKTRTMICVISDAATQHPAELALHLRMALREGWTEHELSEALLQLVGYLGVPATREALMVATKTFAEVRAEQQG